MVVQPHTQLECTTLIADSGVVSVVTAAGRASANFEASSLQLVSSITSVTPSVWSTTSETPVVIEGDQ